MQPQSGSEFDIHDLRRHLDRCVCGPDFVMQMCNAVSLSLCRARRYLNETKQRRRLFIVRRGNRTRHSSTDNQ